MIAFNMFRILKNNPSEVEDICVAVFQETLQVVFVESLKSCHPRPTRRQPVTSRNGVILLFVSIMVACNEGGMDAQTANSQVKGYFPSWQGKGAAQIDTGV